jgi:hypothetical protein
LDSDVPELVFGINIIDAIEKGGYDISDMDKLDFYEEGDTADNYTLDQENHIWELNAKG